MLLHVLRRGLGVGGLMRVPAVPRHVGHPSWEGGDGGALSNSRNGRAECRCDGAWEGVPDHGRTEQGSRLLWGQNVAALPKAHRVPCDDASDGATLHGSLIS